MLKGLWKFYEEWESDILELFICVSFIIIMGMIAYTVYDVAIENREEFKYYDNKG